MRTGRVQQGGLVTAGVALLAGGVVVWGAVRAIAFGEQQPARAMLLFGGIALAVALVDWFEGQASRQDSVHGGVGGDALDIRGFPVWVAVLLMLAVTVTFEGIAGDSADGVLVAGPLAAVLGIAVLCRRMTLEVYGILAATGIALGLVFRTVDLGPLSLAAGSLVLLGVGYWAGDRTASNGVRARRS